MWRAPSNTNATKWSVHIGRRGTNTWHYFEGEWAPQLGDRTLCGRPVLGPVTATTNGEVTCKTCLTCLLTRS